MPLLLANFIYSRDCKLNLRKNVDTTGHYGEQLTLNQWILDSSPRWCAKKSRNVNCGFFLYLPKYNLRD